MKYILVTFIGLILSLSLRIPHVNATSCTGLPAIGNTALSNCTLTVADITGVDQASNLEVSTTNTATLTLNPGAALTINAGGTLAVGSISLNGGTIAIASSGNLKPNTPLYIPDADADGYATSFTNLFTATSSGRRRLSLMKSASAADCNDAPGNYNVTNSCCVVATYYVDADFDGYGTGGGVSMCPAAGYAANNTDCNDGNADIYTNRTGYTDADGDGYGTTTPGTVCSGAALPVGYVANNTDCNDTGTSSGNVYISASCYTDADNDNYGSTTAKTCTNNANCLLATWASGANGTAASAGNFASVNTDCYEANANVYPGSASCSTANRGDGSFDYNCSSTSTKCGSTFDRVYVMGIWASQCQSYCGGPAQRRYDVAAVSCGSYAYSCWNFENYPTSCGNEKPAGGCQSGTNTSNCVDATGGYQACQ